MRRLFSFLFLLTFLFSCAPQTPSPSLRTAFYVYRFSPPGLIGFSPDLQALGEIPFSVPPNCGLLNIASPPMGSFLAIELSCPNGQTVLFLDTNTAGLTQPVRDSDSHFLAWTYDGNAAYLKVDSLGSPHVVRVSTDGTKQLLSLPEFTYALATTSQDAFTFAVSRGLGQGSELHLSEGDGRTSQLLYADPSNYISFAHFSPDATQIVFIKIPDTQTPFSIGELWIMNRDGSNARKLAEADAGHGYATSWSPDGKRIAFVVRENAEDERANQSSEALISNIYVVEVETGTLTQVTHLEDGRVESPEWSPQGNMLAFHVVINDRMEVQIADLLTGEIRALMTESTCCPVWLRK
jgi:dipeptidyl aminopeptidase/acylaminoacyl peptidase